MTVDFFLAGLFRPVCSFWWAESSFNFTKITHFISSVQVKGIPYLY